jgi:hypothetical protein
VPPPPPHPPHPADRFGKTITVSNRVTIRDGTTVDDDVDDDDIVVKEDEHRDDRENDATDRSISLSRRAECSAFLPYRPSTNAPGQHRHHHFGGGGGGGTTTTTTTTTTASMPVQPPPKKMKDAEGGGKSIEEDGCSDDDNASDDEIKAANSRLPGGNGDDDIDIDIDAGPPPPKESRDDDNIGIKDDDVDGSSDATSDDCDEGRERPVVFIAEAPIGERGGGAVGNNDDGGDGSGGGGGLGGVGRILRRPQPISTVRATTNATTIAGKTTLKRTHSSLDGDATTIASENMANIEDMTPKHINVSRRNNRDPTIAFDGDDGNKRPKSQYDCHHRVDYDWGFHDRDGGGGVGYGGYAFPRSPRDGRSHPTHERDVEDRQDRPTISRGGNEGGASWGRSHNQGLRQTHDGEHYYQDTHDQGGGGEGGIKSSWTTPGDGDGAAPGLDYSNSHEYAGNGSIGPSSLINYSNSLSWEMPAGTLSGIENSLTFDRDQAAGGTEGSHEADGDSKKGEGVAATTDDDDNIPLLTTTGSTNSRLPPRKRALFLTPPPSAAGPSGELFDLSHATVSATRRDDGYYERQHHDMTIEQRDTTPEPRDDGMIVPQRGAAMESNRPARQHPSYVPATVHFPGGSLHQTQQPTHHHCQQVHPRQHPHQHHQHHQHPSQVHHYNSQHLTSQRLPPPYYANDSTRFGYDPRYEPSRENFSGGRGRYGGVGPGRCSPHFQTKYSPGANKMGGLGSAPWAASPHVPNYPSRQQHHSYKYDPSQPPYYEHYYPSDDGLPPMYPGIHGMRADIADSGREDSGYASERSLTSTLSKKSFRSMEDLDEPMQGLLYRASFSWEQGLDVPAGGGNPESSVMVSFPLQTSSRGSGRIDIIPKQLSQQTMLMKALAMRSEIRAIGNPNSSVGLILLLAMPQDRHCLSETLCIIRNNVEVFTATENDINAPAPGRKRPIQVGQVGLRCVYCRMCPQRDRVKRATCFPSSMKRIYRAVIDMKLDHFKHCPYVPAGLKARLDQLQTGSTRSTGMTVKYFVKSAKEMGMSDSVIDGVFIDLNWVGNPRLAERDDYKPPPPHGMITADEVAASSCEDVIGQPYSSHQHSVREHYEPKQPRHKKTVAPHFSERISHDDVRMTVPLLAEDSLNTSNVPEKRFTGKVILALPEDENFLSPLRCFLRKNVCAFTASQQDIAVRTPTTFSVRVGQVGVGCVHCLAVSPKLRSNRAVCFPFAMGRIYQSVADIQRFHLGECRMMPQNVRTEFLRLQSESAKGSRGLATRMYWIDSAKKIGLTDGPLGMYFHRDPSMPSSSTHSFFASVDNFDATMRAADNNVSSRENLTLVVPEDKSTIAEFLYLVMEQLRPCRFTDADRNKRRSKNVGCIGVECKHCAGKIDGRKFFWSSVSAAESNFVSVHSHMLTCKYIPEPLRAELTILKTLRREQTSRLKTGSQKAFFIRVWSRLHGESVPPQPSEDTQKLGGKVKPSPKGDFAPEVSTSNSFTRDMLVDAPMKSEDGSTVSKEDSCSLYSEAPLILRTGHSNDSDDLRAFLESKSTLSSMPSVDESFVKNAIRDSEAAETVLAAQSDESAVNIYTTASKSSMNSVARNLSAFTMHCKEEEKEEHQQHTHPR